MTAGDPIELKVTPDRYLTVRYAGASGDFNPIHIDEEFAKSVGLPGRILHGLWTMSQVARAVSQAGELKRLEVQFRGMGFPEQEITVTSTVTDEADGVAQIETEAQQDGRRIVRKGKAEVVLRL
jgi:acyl dehydratase